MARRGSKRTGLPSDQRGDVVEALRRMLKEIVPVSINYDFNSPEYQAAHAVIQASHRLGGLLSGNPDVLMPKLHSTHGPRREGW